MSKLHVEVSVSSNPVGYMTLLTNEAMAELGASSVGAAVARPPHLVKQCAEAWVDKKFNHPLIAMMREDFSSGEKWEKVFVHGVFNHPEELDHIRNCGVQTMHISSIMNDLMHPQNGRSTSGEVKDILRMMKLTDQ